MFFKLFLLFVTVSLLELAVLIKIGVYIGTLNTILLVILTAAAGAMMAKLEGLGVMFRIQEGLSQGIFPADELINGAMILVAGAMLLTPGFLTDTLGFLMIFPPSREVIKRFVRRRLKNYMNTIEIHRM